MNSSNEYDFIIIGGGTSGLVLASRLTENPATHVLVLEAGENHLSDPRVNIPALWPSLLGSDCDWGFATTPQVNLCNERTVYWLTVKILEWPQWKKYQPSARSRIGRLKFRELAGLHCSL